MATLPENISKADASFVSARIADQVYEAVKGEGVPRSGVDAVLRAYEQLREAEPQLREVDLTYAFTLIAATKVSLTLPGKGAGEISRLGDHAAVSIIGALNDAGIRLMTEGRPVSSGL